LDEKLHTSERKHRRPVWRIAATIALVATISALLIFQYSDNSSTVQAGQMSDELSQVVDHYNRLTDQKLGDISNCAASNEEAAKIDEMARVQLEELEKDAGVLQEELIRDDSNDRVYGALVNNYRTRIKILDNIIAKICQL
ncbi:MAG: hypothetical protein DRI83_11555, partial [Bacteroidetes bacterium]